MESHNAQREAYPPRSAAGKISHMAASSVAQYLAALPADRRAASAPCAELLLHSAFTR
ncbi:MAG: hypothetical protein M3032_04045 [Verrucomicrobiota bacterium]|nr:hypothetical protein [Verrucomicrobiota bacterium]